jgi:hypothetical protein
MNSRSDDKAIKELSTVLQDINPVALSLNERQRVRTSHHVGKRSSVGSGRKELYVEIERDAGKKREHAGKPSDFKLPKVQRKELPAITMKEIPSELTRWIEEGDMDQSVEEFLDSVMSRQKAAFSQLVKEHLDSLSTAN